MELAEKLMHTMERQTVEDLIKVISKSSDKNKICRALIKLRTDLVKDKAGIRLFFECDGVPPLIRLITKPYEKILETSLSILGNCCTMKDCCKQVISHGIVPPLLTILKSIPSQSVQCKVCRLIGNLARESNEKLCTLAKGIGVAIAAIIDESNDIATLIMSIRAVRLLWNEMPFFDEFVRSDGIKKILSILVKYAKIDQKCMAKSIVEKYPAERARVEFMEEHIYFMESINSKLFDQEIMKKNKPVEDLFKMPKRTIETDLFTEIFRCLQVIIAGLSLRVINDFNVDQRACNCVVFFAKVNSPFREQALRILSKLTRFQDSNNILCNADAITSACNLITQQNSGPPLTESEERHCVNIICFLSRDACNRAKIRISGSLKRLLEIAKNTKCDSILSTILFGLQSFKYDNVSIDVMIKMGLIKVLVERLNSNMVNLSENHVKRQRSWSTDVVIKSVQETTTNDNKLNDIKSKRLRVECSPLNCIPLNCIPTSPSNSTLNYSNPNSPCSLFALSPLNTSPRNNEINNDDCSEYSPVCSDIEDNNEDDNADVKNEKDSEKIDGALRKNESPIIGIDFDSIVQSDEEQPIAQDKQSLKDEDVKDNVKDEKNASVEKKKTIQLIICLLCAVSFRAKIVGDLCTTETLSALLRTCKVAFKRNTIDSKWDEQGAPLLLSHIVSKTENFTRVIKQDFIFKIYKFTQSERDHKNCSTCQDLYLVGNGLLDTLKNVADSGYGHGELAHLLLKGDKQTQKHISVVSTYIVRNPKILHKLLVECGGLYTVMDIILSKDLDLCNVAGSGLTSLSNVLGISVKQYDQSKIKQNLKYNHTKSISFDENSSTISFYAATPSTHEPSEINNTTDSNDASNNKSVRQSVEFSEQILITYSDVFNSMLKNDFKESHSREIHLKNQTIAGIKYFLHSINQMYHKDVLHVPSNEEINIVLEAHDMCQIYMLSELEAEIYNVILYCLNETTVCQIFEFAVANHKQELSEIAIKYYLSANIKDEVKVKMFCNADNSKYFKEWNQMMLDTVVYTCENLMANS